MIERIADLLFPQDIYCLCCGSVTDSSRRYQLCDGCVTKFGWIGEDTCEVCGKPLSEMNKRRGLCYDCLRRGHIFDKGYTCSQYGLYERALVMDLKYRGKSYIARALGRIMADRIEAECGEDMPGWDIVTWVPVHRKRLAERGYDQAELMAGFFVKSLAELKGGAGAGGIPQLAGVLERAQQTAPMKDLSVAERMENVKGAFSVRRRARVEGKSILVIDDIYTTGATLDACAGALKEGGAARVEVMTFASGGDFRGEGRSHGCQEE